MIDHWHEYSSQSDYRFNHGEDGYHNGVEHTHKMRSSRAVLIYDAGRPRVTATYQANMDLYVTVEGGKATKLTVSPKEADAGYFGAPIGLWDGVEPEGEREPDEIWALVGEYLRDNQGWGSGDRYFLHWEG